MVHVTATARRIGMYGGAFDPPHNAHVALAKAAITQLELDELRVFPTGHAWHKTQRLSPAKDRLAMAALAFDNVDHLVIDDREIRRAGPTYSKDTLLELQAEYPDAQIYLVMGADQAAALPTWSHFEEITKLAIICVAERADKTGSISYSATLNNLVSSHLKPAIHIELPFMPESATDIRDLVGHGKTIDNLLPSSVALYIEKHHLYQSNQTSA